MKDRRGSSKVSEDVREETRVVNLATFRWCIPWRDRDRLNTNKTARYDLTESRPEPLLQRRLVSLSIICLQSVDIFLDLPLVLTSFVDRNKATSPMRSGVDSVATWAWVLIVDVGITRTPFSCVELHIRGAGAAFAKRERMAPFSENASVARHHVSIANVAVAAGPGVCGESALVAFAKCFVGRCASRGREESQKGKCRDRGELRTHVVGLNDNLIL